MVASKRKEEGELTSSLDRSSKVDMAKPVLPTEGIRGSRRPTATTEDHGGTRSRSCDPHRLWRALWRSPTSPEHRGARNRAEKHGEASVRAITRNPRFSGLRVAKPRKESKIDWDR